MSAAAQFRTEHVSQAPRGWRVKTVVPGPGSKHEVRIAFPPGRRKKGAGKVVEILHPKDERNPKCTVSQKARHNPGELLIFGNPTKLEQQRAARDRAERIRAARLNGHKATCQCFACKHKRGEKNSSGGWGRFSIAGGGQDRTEFSTKKEARKHAKKLAKETGKSVHYLGPKNQPHAVRNPKRSGPRRRRADRNPSDTKQAVRLFQGFHGHDPKEIAEKHVSAAVRLDYTALGDLNYFVVETPLGKEATFTFHGDGVKLASSPDGKQLYCIGGNQNILPLLDERSQEKDFIDLGEGLEVEYFARKVHGEFRPIRYYHEFGEVNGSRPRLMFDKLRKHIFFIGGDYFIDVNVRAPGTPLGKVSPGIEN